MVARVAGKKTKSISKSESNAQPMAADESATIELRTSPVITT